MRLTLLLVVINIAVYFLSLTNSNFFIQNYGFNSKNFLDGNYHIMITSMFLHANMSHLISNMIALLFLGLTIERNVSKMSYASVYFISGVVGNLSFMIPFFGFTPETIAIGASAAISGLVGLGTFVCPSKFVFFPAAIPLPFVLAGSIYLLANLSNIFLPSQIAYSAHILGMLSGAAFGLVWGEEKKKSLLVFIVLMVLIWNYPSIISNLG